MFSALSLCGRVTSNFFKYKLKLKLRYLIRCEKGICFARFFAAFDIRMLLLQNRM